ncbi:MAG: hypothetical protein HQM10_17575 [Candidatus Riflebacteria bacterium]|nr:hypothetical protein [Candidatus Riflebacteria bacterium]
MKIFFFEENLLKGYLLSSDGVFTQVTDIPDENSILLLPVSSGLPFEVEIPFPDPEKASRILPEMLCDVFSNVPQGSKISWEYLQKDEKLLVSGLLFSDGNLIKVIEGFDWRIAIPESYIFPQDISSERNENRLIQMESPSGKFIQSVDEKTGFRKYFFMDRGIPYLVPDSSRLSCINILLSGKLVLQELDKLFENSQYTDVSGWRIKKSEHIKNTVKFYLLFLIIGILFLLNLLIFFEEKELLRNRRELASHLKKAFETSFPGEKSVEPLLQSQKILSELEKTSALRKPPLMVDLAVLFSDMRSIFEGNASVTRVIVSGPTWKIQGETSGYQVLEELVKTWNGKSAFKNAKYTDARPLSGRGKEEILSFSLEGQVVKH